MGPSPTSLMASICTAYLQCRLMGGFEHATFIGPGSRVSRVEASQCAGLRCRDRVPVAGRILNDHGSSVSRPWSCNRIGRSEAPVSHSSPWRRRCCGRPSAPLPPQETRQLCLIMPVFRRSEEDSSEIIGPMQRWGLEANCIAAFHAGHAVDLAGPEGCYRLLGWAARRIPVRMGSHSGTQVRRESDDVVAAMDGERLSSSAQLLCHGLGGGGWTARQTHRQHAALTAQSVMFAAGTQHD